MKIAWVLWIAALVLQAGCGEEARDRVPVQGVARDAMPKDGNEALQWLLEGNARFAEDRTQHLHEGLRRRAQLVEGQHPAAVVLGCADSRVPPELVFDAGLGDLFVVRVAGNLADDDEAGSIEYAVDHLDVPLVLVLGHEGCGAVTAALGATEGEAQELSRLLESMKPALREIDPTLPMEERVRLGVDANVRHSVARLQAIVEREGGAKPAPGFRIVGGVYELDSGRVRLLD
ncbi:MAG: carbonic anhydrase [Myxococcota bacterium]